MNKNKRMKVNTTLAIRLFLIKVNIENKNLKKYYRKILNLNKIFYHHNQKQ